MQDHAGGVDDATQSRRDRHAQGSFDEHHAFFAARLLTPALGIDLVPDGFDDPLVPKLTDEVRVRGLVHQPAYSWQG